MKLKWRKYKEYASNLEVILNDKTHIDVGYTGYTCLKLMMENKYFCMWYPTRETYNLERILISNSQHCVTYEIDRQNVHRVLRGLPKKQRDMFLFDSLNDAMVAAQRHFDA